MAISDTKFRRLTLENVRRAPRKRGVYALYTNRKLFYIGLAEGGVDTIRSRLRKHLGTDANGATAYKREASAAPEARMQTLLAEHEAAHGTLPSRNRE